MNRNQYDGDNTTWSPQGRLFQLEYAMEAVKQGSCSVGVRSNTHAVVATLKRASGELGSHQQKVFPIDSHMGVAVSGLWGDARSLTRYLRTEALNHRFVYECPAPVERLVAQVADKAQVHTQKYGTRPYGVGLLVIGYDATGPHLFETCPSGNYFEFKGQAIGSRAQSARTYLERVMGCSSSSSSSSSSAEQREAATVAADAVANASLDELIRHAVKALRESVQSGSEGLTAANCAVGVVGKDLPFSLLEEDAVRPYVSSSLSSFSHFIHTHFSHTSTKTVGH